MNTPRVGGPEILTRTILQIGTPIADLRVLEIKRALQRVPGVLLAEIDGANGRAMVAHDSAVPMASLLAAVAANGANAGVVAEPRAAAVSGGVALPLATVLVQRLLFVAAVVLLLPLIGTLSPTIAKNHLLIPIVLAFVWAVVLTRTFLHRT